jgi:N-acetyl-1-D-myo-inositol-2-amino-2-deoxy-alpha-D-glucopyranoside deacetylase
MERLRKPLILVAALVGGLIAGLLGTVIEQSVLRIGTVELPWGLVLALALALFYLLGLRLTNESRWPSILGLIGVLITSLITLNETPGGSVLVPANTWGTLWSAAPGIIGAIVVAWPRLKRQPAVDAN